MCLAKLTEPNHSHNHVLLVTTTMKTRIRFFFIKKLLPKNSRKNGHRCRYSKYIGNRGRHNYVIPSLRHTSNVFNKKIINFYINSLQCKKIFSWNCGQYYRRYYTMYKTSVHTRNQHDGTAKMMNVAIF